MTKKLLRRLNAQFLPLGRNPYGRPNFLWSKACDMHYLYEKGLKETKTPAGLYVMQTEYERHSFADLYGDIWCVAMWQAPMPRDEWIQRFGNEFPWPPKGDYRPIDSTQLPVGMEPDEDLTQYSVFKIYQHLGIKMPEHIENTYRDAERMNRRARCKWEDFVDDAMFVGAKVGHIPGRKDAVSFNSAKCAGKV